MYERIIDKVDASFIDMQTAFGYLPEKQRNKIDLINSYNRLLEYVKKRNLAREIPDKQLRNVITELEQIWEKNFNNEKLKKLAKPDFLTVLDWLRYLERKTPTHEELDPALKKSPFQPIPGSISS